MELSPLLKPIGSEFVDAEWRRIRYYWRSLIAMNIPLFQNIMIRKRRNSDDAQC